jgi:hypothetical protein
MMELTRNTAPSAAALFDPQGLWSSWQDASGRAAEQGASLSREAFASALRLLEQGAAAGQEWARACGLSAQRVSEMARAAEHEVGRAEDLPGLWNAELGLLAEVAQAAAALGQDAWNAFARQQASMLQAALAQGTDNLERVMQAANGTALGVAQPAAGEPSLPWPAFTPPQPVTLPQMAEAMVRTMQAFWMPVADGGTGSRVAEAPTAVAADRAGARRTPHKRRAGH